MAASMVAAPPLLALTIFLLYAAFSCNRKRHIFSV
jgi:hypothetical protein